MVCLVSGGFGLLELPGIHPWKRTPVKWRPRIAIIPHAGLCRTVGLPFSKMRRSWDPPAKLSQVYSA